MSDFAYPLHEECGVFGIYDRAGTEDVAAAAYSALYALQHRGQESCGIAVNDDGVITGHRDLGLVNEVFTPEVLASLSTTTAHMATGHYYRVKMDELEIEKYLRLRGRISVFLSNAED